MSSCCRYQVGYSLPDGYYHSFQNHRIQSALGHISPLFNIPTQPAHALVSHHRVAALAYVSPLTSFSMACSDTVEKLLAKLDRIGVNNSHMRINQLLEAFRSAWQKGDIENFGETHWEV